MDGLAFLESPAIDELQSVYVLHGDEEFIKRRVLAALKLRVLGPDDDGFGLSTHAGDKATFAAVRDDLDTLPFLGSRRLVVVEQADPFVTNHRAALEKYLTKPSARGILVLDVHTWTSNTKLAKALAGDSTLTCKVSVATYKLPQWCATWATSWSASAHGKQLATTAARLLIDLVGTDLGLLDQELAKLATYIGKRTRIEVKDVDQLVGRSRAANVFKIFAAMGNGRVGEALGILDQLFEQGEDEHRILGAFSMQLRRLVKGARLKQQGQSLPEALKQAGVLPFAIEESAQQLRHLGMRRINQLCDWLLEIDLGLKGSSQLPPRLLLERFVVRLARPNT